MLNITKTIENGKAAFALEGRLDTVTAPELEQELKGALEGVSELNFRDAEALGIVSGERVKVSSRRGSITATARVGRKVSQGESWMPFHFPDSPVNRLTNAALDEFARIPEYKVCAVRVEKLT